MLNKEKYLNILKGYFPFGLAPDIPGHTPFFEPLFENWLDWILESDKMSFAITGLREKMAMRTDEDQEELVGHVLAACFIARGYKDFRPDTPDYIRKQNRNTINNIKSILEDIEKLQGSITNHENDKNTSEIIDGHERKIPAVIGIGPYINSKIITSEEYRIVSQFLMPHHPALSLDKLNKLLSIYHKLLKFDLDGLNQAGSSKKPSYIYYETGPLKYPKKLTPSQQSSKPELNGLIFNLALLFRQYTDTQNKGRWLVTQSGTMLDVGNPCHDLTTSFVNATFFNENENIEAKKAAGHIAKDEPEDHELYESHITQRLQNLTKNGVEFTSWMN